MDRKQFLQVDSSTDFVGTKKVFIDLTGDFISGVVLNQLVYWCLRPDKIGESKLRVKKEGKLWIAREHKDWWDDCRVTERQVRRVIPFLKRMGLIETRVFKFNGTPTMHIRIVEDTFYSLYESALLETEGTKWEANGSGGKGQNEMAERARTKWRKGPEPLTESTTENTDKEERQSSPNGDSLLSTANSLTKTLGQVAAEKLYTALSIKRKIMRKPNMKAWSAIIDDFLWKSGTSVDRFKKVVSWYCKNIGASRYVPKAYSATSLCDKFVNIEDAMENKGYHTEEKIKEFHDKLCSDVSSKYWNKHGWGSLVTQENVDVILVELGASPGDIRFTEI